MDQASEVHPRLVGQLPIIHRLEVDCSVTLATTTQAVVVLVDSEQTTILLLVDCSETPTRLASATTPAQGYSATVETMPLQMPLVPRPTIPTACLAPLRQVQLWVNLSQSRKALLPHHSRLIQKKTLLRVMQPTNFKPSPSCSLIKSMLLK